MKMGTRGTLRVYVNNELKIRQYNQWDSYPTGQFKNICAFMDNKELVEDFTQSLLNKTFAKSEDIKKIRDEGKHLSEEVRLTEAYIVALTNRDIGARIIPLIAGLPDLFDHPEVIPDWCDVFECEDASLREEGNYVIHIECELDECQRFKKYLKNGSEVRFKLSGEFWEKEREFDWNYIPTDDEIIQWEKEAGLDQSSGGE